MLYYGILRNTVSYYLLLQYAILNNICWTILTIPDYNILYLTIVFLWFIIIYFAFWALVCDRMYIMWYYAVLCCDMLYYALLCCTMLDDAISRYIVLYQYTLLYSAIPCHIVLWLLLSCIMLDHAMLCCTMPLHAVLYSDV